MKTLEFLNDFFENAPDGFFSVDATDGRIRMVNQTAVRRLGYDLPSQLIGKDLKYIYDESCHGLVDRLYQEFVDKGHIATNQILLRHRAGYPIRATLNVSGVFSKDKQLLYSRSIIRDYNLESADVTVSSSREDWIGELTIEKRQALLLRLERFEQDCRALLDHLPGECGMLNESTLRVLFDAERVIEKLSLEQRDSRA